MKTHFSLKRVFILLFWTKCIYTRCITLEEFRRTRTCAAIQRKKKSGKRRRKKRKKRKSGENSGKGKEKREKADTEERKITQPT